MHPCAFGDLVDDPIVGPQGNSRCVGFGSVILGKYGAVGDIMPRTEHFLDLGNRIETRVVCTVTDLGQHIRRAGQYDCRLH